MACMPFLQGGKHYRFEAIVKLHSLISVPYVNAVTFAKLRLLNTRHSSQYSPRVEVSNHTVTWNSEHRFICKFRGSTETAILEPNVLKISIRMETKGGKSFCKVGYVSVDLACFTGLGNVTSRRRYILEGYDVKHKRLDNSLLLASFSMRQLFGDTCFRPPAENLSNCLIQPPESDDADDSNFMKHNAPPVNSCLPLVDSTTNAPLLLPQVAAHPNEHSSSIDRILESIHSASTGAYSHPPSRPNSVMSIGLNACSSSSPVNVLAGSSFLPPGSDRMRPLFQQRRSAVLTSEQLASLLSDVLQSKTNAAPHSSALHVTSATGECSRAGTESTARARGTINHVNSCQVMSSSLAPVSISSRSRGSSISIPARFEHTGSMHPVGSTTSSQPVLIRPSDSTSPSSTPLDNTLVNSQNSDNQSTSQKPTFSLPDNPLEDDVSSRPPFFMMTDIVNVTSIPVTLDTFENSFCHSLPLPAHYSARRLCDMPFTGVPPSQPSYPDYFATDSGLLLPSRRRKFRPVADYAFPLSHIHPPFETVDNSEPSSAYASKSDVIPELQRGQHLITAGQPIDASLISCLSTCGDGHSSGYQSHSRQSSLESHAIPVPCTAPISTQCTLNLALPTPDSATSDNLLTETSSPS